MNNGSEANGEYMLTRIIGTVGISLHNLQTVGEFVMIGQSPIEKDLPDQPKKNEDCGISNRETSAFF